MRLKQCSTINFRYGFTVDEPPALLFVRLQLQRDDGAIVYLNGVEIFRSNLPADPVDYLTPASSGVAGDEEEIFRESFVDSALLQIGTNTLAVEVHQIGPASSDISFNASLEVPEILPVVRGPYLQMATPRSMTLCRRTLVESDSVVWFGPQPDQLLQQVTDVGLTTEHHVTLSSLQPDTTYYAVGDSEDLLAGGDSEHHFVTPSAEVAGSARIWVIGDSGTADSSAAAFSASDDFGRLLRARLRPVLRFG